ncbi:unnamed protein product [Spirodela intermedia]|uniref:Cyclin-like domain-containing protein n=1 Tax=Spirodela intermedia TaxID=51605 RepID=A0A7I8JH70_SPIIN|nr:unnamed protein product [Spirodela intermedia]CAA6669478.1 unnamed protein product [Spirodela intermedia]
MRLKVPQVTIATAIIFCHRFFLRQSLAKNDRRTIATVCMFLAGKVEETPRLLKDVIHLSYEIINKKDPAASQRIKLKEVYEQQKLHILLGEKVVLSTLGFDLNLLHPYKPLVEAIKRFKVAQNALAQVAWNFVNDGLRTSLCLQYEPHHIAAGAIFLAAKFLKVKLPSDGDRVWWQEFDVSPRQLEDVSNQMLELYEQNHSVQAPSGCELDGSTSNTTAHRSVKTAVSGLVSAIVLSQGGGLSNVKHGASLPSSARSLANQLCSENQSTAHLSNEVGNSESTIGDRGCGMNEEGKKSELLPCGSEKLVEASSMSKFRQVKHPLEVGVEGDQGAAAAAECGGSKDGRSSSFKSSGEASQSSKEGEAPKLRCLPDVMKRIDKDKVKAALEKRKRSRGDRAKNTESVDEDDLIERELESGVELGAEDERRGRSNGSSYEPEGAEDRGHGEKDNANKANHASFDEGDGRGRVSDPENGLIRRPREKRHLSTGKLPILISSTVAGTNP